MTFVIGLTTLTLDDVTVVDSQPVPPSPVTRTETLVPPSAAVSLYVLDAAPPLMTVPSRSHW